MAGLREKHKEDRRLRILQAASALFRAEGYEAVRIEDIAARADVSPGTCYNYFQTKGDILLAIVSMEVEEVIEAGRAVLADPPGDIAQALDRLIGLYFGHSLHYLSKAMWRQAMSLSIGAPETPFSARYTALDGLLTAQVCDLLAELQRRDLVRADADTQALGQVVFNSLNQMFTEYVKADAMKVEVLMAATARQHRALAELMGRG